MKEFILAMLLLLIFTSVSYAADEKKEVNQQEMSQFVDVMYTKILEIFARPETAELEATHYKNLYDALLKKGFSKSEAIRIVVSQGRLIGPRFE